MPLDKTLVTDFDGTLARHEFYQLARDRLLPPSTPNYWADYVAGRATHFESLQKYFAAIRATEAQMQDVLNAMELEPRLAELAVALKAGGWQIVVASAGCEWYIRKLLAAARIELTVHANPGHWQGADRGLVMEPPRDSLFYSPEDGIDKAAIVRHAAARSTVVAFAGDGLPDVRAALLVSPTRRFARGDCAAELTRRQEAFVPFERWSEVAARLLAEDTHSAEKEP